MSVSDHIEFDVIAAGEPSDAAIAALARLLLDAAERDQSNDDNATGEK